MSVVLFFAGAEALPSTMMGIPSRDLEICLGLRAVNGRLADRSTAAAKASDDSTIKSCSVVLSHTIVDTNYKLNALVNRGNAYSRKHQFDLAQAVLDAAVELRARNSRARISRAGLYAQIGKLDQAIADYSIAVEVGWRDWEPYFFRGQAYMRKGEFAAATGDFNEALERASDETDVLFVRAIAYRRHGEIALADADFVAALVQTPRTSGQFNQDCWTKAAMGRDLQGALADCKEAVRLDPKNSAAQDSLAFVELLMGDYAQSIADYDKALAGSEIAASIYCRGIAKLRSGDAAGGNADIAQALKWDAGIADEYANYYGVKP